MSATVVAFQSPLGPTPAFLATQQLLRQQQQRPASRSDIGGWPVVEHGGSGRHGPAQNPKSILLASSDGDDTEDVPSDATLLASLQNRLGEIRTDANAVLKRWRAGKCRSAIRLSLDDWVRRIDVHTWPFALVGSSSGSIYLADLSVGSTIAKADGVHDAQGGDEEMLELMFGQYDGGGTVALALGGPGGRLAASAGREGGTLAWRLGSKQGFDGGAAPLDGDDLDGIGGTNVGGSIADEALDCLGELAPLAGKAVTCLKIDGEGRLWAGCYDGTVQCLHLANLVNEKDPKPRTASCGSAVLSLDVREDIDLVAVGTASGSVELFSSDEDLDGEKGQLRRLDSWKPKAENIPARSVAIAPFPISLCDLSEDSPSNSDFDDSRDYEAEEDFMWSLVSGYMDGSLHAIPLNINYDSDSIDEDCPLGTGDESEASDLDESVEMRPPHNGPVTCITSRKGGILVTGAQDGTIRIWDSTPRCASDASVNQGVARESYDPRCLYGLGGYKVWLGSASTSGDGLRLVSDGSDNTIIVHDFSVPEETEDENDGRTDGDRNGNDDDDDDDDDDDGDDVGGNNAASQYGEDSFM